MVLDPHKLELKDYLECFKSAHLLILMNFPLYIISTICLLILFGLSVSYPILLAIIPILIVLAFYLSAFLASGCDNNSFSIKLLFKCVSLSRRYITLTMILAGTIFALFGPFSIQIIEFMLPGWPELLGINLKDAKPLVSTPEKAISFLVFTTGFLLIITDSIQKALVVYKYDLNAWEVFSIMVQATELNRPLILMAVISLTMVVLWPVMFLWFIAPYSIFAFSNFVYFLNKALFDGNAKVEIKKLDLISSGVKSI